MFSSARTLAILLAIGTAGLTSACGMKGSLALPPPEQRTPAVLDRIFAPKPAPAKEQNTTPAPTEENVRTAPNQSR